MEIIEVPFLKSFVPDLTAWRLVKNDAGRN